MGTGGICVTIITYQSSNVLRILKQNRVYRAYPSLKYKREYAALIDMLGLHCVCPVFGVLPHHRQNTNGKVSSSVRLVLEVPDEHVKLTEYGVWADFLYFSRFSKPDDYRKLMPDCDEITQQAYTDLIRDLTEQRPSRSYRTPQAVLEEILPEWVVSAKKADHETMLDKIFSWFGGKR